MDKVAELYSQMSIDHQREARWAMESIKNKIPWVSNETVLDVGCGPGDVLIHVIKPALPPDFSRLVGIDKKGSMIEYARNRRIEEVDSRVSFLEMDIGTHKDPLLFFDKEIQDASGFTKIFSFFCLHWVKDRKRLMENLNVLLQPGGHAFLLLVVKSGVYNVWDKFVNIGQWKEYFKDVKTPINDYVYMDNCDDVFCNAAEEAGFRILYNKVIDRPNAFLTKTESDEEKILRLRTVDPLMGFLPDDKVDDYMKQVLKVIKTEVSQDGATDYTALVVLLRKD